MFINKVTLPEEAKDVGSFEDSHDKQNSKSLQSLKEELQGQITKLKESVEPLV